MTEKYVNTVQTTLAVAITSSAQSTITVSTTTGFPTTGQFRILVINELMLVTGVSGTTWAVSRAIEGSTAVSSAPIGSQVNAIFTAGALDQIRNDMVSSGPYVNLPAVGDNNVGDLYIPTDSFYDLLRYNGTSWDHFRNGFKMTPPINSQFSWDNQSTGTVNTDHGGVVGFSQPGGGGFQIRYKSAPSVPYTITTAFLPHYWQSNYNTVGIGWRDAVGGGKFHMIGPSYGNFSYGWMIRSYRWNNPTSYNGDYAQYPIPPMIVHGPIVWMQMWDDGTNRGIRLSSNGINFSDLLTLGRTDFLTPTQVMFGWGDIAADVGITLLHWKEA
jgi:hypothetical protein